MATTTKPTMKKETREKISHMSDEIIGQLQDIKKRVAKMDPAKKRKTVSLLAGVGAILAGISTYRKIQNRRKMMY